MKIAYVIFLLMSLLHLNAQDSWAYLHETRPNRVQKLSTQVVIGVGVIDYERVAKNLALSDLSLQLYSLVNTYKSSQRNLYQSSDNKDTFSTYYDEKIYVTSELPIVRPITTRSEIIDQQYILKMELDFSDSGPIYQQLADGKAKEINVLYESLSHLDDGVYLKRALGELKKRLSEYEKFALASLIMDYKPNIKPSVSTMDIDVWLKKIEDTLYLGDPVEYFGFDINN